LLIRIFAFAYRNWIFAKRNFFAFAEILFWPFVSLVSIGLMGNFLDLKSNLLNFVLTGAIASGVLQVTQLDVSYGLLYEIWSKSIKHTSSPRSASTTTSWAPGVWAWCGALSCL
jgi:ABC-2 type transport system permease protein